ITVIVPPRRCVTVPGLPAISVTEVPHGTSTAGHDCAIVNSCGCPCLLPITRTSLGFRLLAMTGERIVQRVPRKRGALHPYRELAHARQRDELAEVATGRCRVGQQRMDVAKQRLDLVDRLPLHCL